MSRFFLICSLWIFSNPCSAAWVTVFDTPEKEILARFALLEGAKSAFVSSYVTGDDEVAFAHAEKLRQLQQGGGQAGILLDDYSGGERLRDAVLAVLADAGVDVFVFNPLRLRHLSKNLRRMHDKLFVIGSDKFFTGGRGIGDSFFGYKKAAWVDRDILVEDSEQTTKVRAYLAHLVQTEAVVRPDLRQITESEKDNARRFMKQALANVEEYFRANVDGNPVLGDFRADVKNVQFHASTIDGTGAILKNGALKVVREMIMSGARKVTLETPYFTLPPPIREALAVAADNGSEIELYTNSWKSSNHLTSFVGFAAQLPKIARLGIRAHEFIGDVPYHTKTILVDDRILVGSFNLNHRSSYQDTEVVVSFESDEISAYLHRVRTNLANAFELVTDQQQVVRPRSLCQKAAASLPYLAMLPIRYQF